MDPRRVFTSYFINPGPLEPEAQQLITGRQLKIIATGLGKLATAAEMSPAS